jgi:hypothetical protein
VIESSEDREVALKAREGTNSPYSDLGISLVGSKGALKVALAWGWIGWIRKVLLAGGKRMLVSRRDWGLRAQIKSSES